LAAVLAHEIAHVIRKHHYKVIRKQQMLEFGMNAVEIEGADNAKKLSGMVAQILARGLDKSAEFEADRDGMVYSARAGYDSSSMLRIMEKLAASSAKDEATQLLLSTHPSSSARQSAITTVINVDIEKAAVKSSASARFGSHLEK
jgi:predicted Zn-dependent protease